MEKYSSSIFHADVYCHNSAITPYFPPFWKQSLTWQFVVVFFVCFNCRRKQRKQKLHLKFLNDDHEGSQTPRLAGMVIAICINAQRDNETWRAAHYRRWFIVLQLGKLEQNEKVVKLYICKVCLLMTERGSVKNQLLKNAPLFPPLCKRAAMWVRPREQAVICRGATFDTWTGGVTGEACEWSMLRFHRFSADDIIITLPFFPSFLHSGRPCDAPTDVFGGEVRKSKEEAWRVL